jgi:hypothetical protein
MEGRAGSRIRVAGRWLLLIAVVAQLADAVTFSGAMRAGVPISAESNPLMSLLYGVHGVAGPVEFKMAAIAAMVSLVALGQLVVGARARRFGLVVAASTLIGSVGLLGSLSNINAAAVVLGVR